MPIGEPKMPTMEDKTLTREQEEETKQEEEYVKNWMEKEGINFGDETYIILKEKLCTIKIDENNFYTHISPIEKGSGGGIGGAAHLKGELEAGKLKKATQEEVVEHYCVMRDSLEKEIRYNNKELERIKEIIQRIEE